MKGSQLIRKGSSAYERNIAGKQYKFLVKTEQLAGILVETEPGAYSEFYEHEGEEIKIVIKGEIEYHLREGDVLWHKSNIPHRIKNSSDKKAIIFTVDTPPTFA